MIHKASAHFPAHLLPLSRTDLLLLLSFAHADPCDQTFLSPSFAQLSPHPATDTRTQRHLPGPSSLSCHLSSQPASLTVIVYHTALGSLCVVITRCT